MKPRIVKKLSKKTLAIFAASPRRDLQQDAERSWIDDEFEGGYVPVFDEKISKRNREQARVSVNHVPSIGGEFCSYSGDADELYPFYEWAARFVFITATDWENFDHEKDDYPKVNIKGRLTGKKVLERLRTQAETEH